jgi:hypothetical protein
MFEFINSDKYSSMDLNFKSAHLLFEYSEWLQFRSEEKKSMRTKLIFPSTIRSTCFHVNKQLRKKKTILGGRRHMKTSEPSSPSEKGRS